MKKKHRNAIAWELREMEHAVGRRLFWLRGTVEPCHYQSAANALERAIGHLRKAEKIARKHDT